MYQEGTTRSPPKTSGMQMHEQSMATFAQVYITQSDFSTINLPAYETPAAIMYGGSGTIKIMAPDNNADGDDLDGRTYDILRALAATTGLVPSTNMFLTSCTGAREVSNERPHGHIREDYAHVMTERRVVR